MSGPAIIPGKRLNPWRYFMNSIFINRFYAVAMWLWLAGMAMGAGGESHNIYLFLAALAAVVVGFWLAGTWETEREKAQWNEERQGRDFTDVQFLSYSHVPPDDDETLDLDRRIALDGIKRIAERAD